MLYHVIRALLGISELLVVVRLCHRLVTFPLLPLSAFLAASAVADLLPAFVWSHGWWAYVWTPFMLLRLLLTVWVSCILLADAAAALSSRARTLLIGWCWCSAMMPTLIAYKANAGNLFQSLAMLRQYVLMVLVGIMGWGWAYLTWHTPTKMNPVTRQAGLLWCWWLVAAFVISTTTKGGLLWSIVDWHGGDVYWRAVSDIGMSAQVLICARWWLIAHRLPIAGVSPAPSLPPRSFAHPGVGA